MALAYLADTGSWTDSMVEACLDVNLIGLEFNHDVTLQRLSRRSPQLIGAISATAAICRTIKPPSF